MGRSALVDKIAIVGGKIHKFCRDNFCLVCRIRIDMVKVFKLCRRMATGVFEKLLFSQSVSLQHLDSQTGHREVGRYSAAQNLVVYINDSLPFGLNSMKHYDSFCPLPKL